MTNPSSKRNLVGLIPILLFAVLAVAVLSVLFTGADTYASITDRGNSAYTMRTAAQYVSTKLRQTDGEIGVDSFGDRNAVVITETINGAKYVTRIYCHGGYLYELFSSAEAEISPDGGEKLMKMDSLNAAMDDGLLTVQLSRGEKTRTVLFTVRNNKEG